MQVKQEQTLVIIKPDGVKRGLVGEVVNRFERRGLKIIALEMSAPTREEMEKHYPTDKDWVTNLGQNLIKSSQEYNIPLDLERDYGTSDIYEIGKKVRGWLIDFMTSGPIVKIVVEGILAIKMVRKIVGPTIPSFAEMGTIRGDFSVDSPLFANPSKRAIRNLIHASGNKAEAEHEINLWFKSNQIHSYKRAEEDTMF
ncbi:nucleoside-diphosphate kinase [Candidatus Parcubacteria bacterium]|nr:MAG: nucleoside-diphosphate kinase [Candidatus Parcubacteria bacterium]